MVSTEAYIPESHLPPSERFRDTAALPWHLLTLFNDTDPGECTLDSASILGVTSPYEIPGPSIIGCQLTTDQEGRQILTLDTVKNTGPTLNFITLKDQGKTILTFDSHNPLVDPSSACAGETDGPGAAIGRSFDLKWWITPGFTTSPEAVGACYLGTNFDDPIEISIHRNDATAHIYLTRQSALQAVYDTVGQGSDLRINMGGQLVSIDQIRTTLEKQLNAAGSPEATVRTASSILDLSQLEPKMQFLLPTPVPTVRATPTESIYTPPPLETITANENPSMEQLGINIYHFPPGSTVYTKNYSQIGTQITLLRDLSQKVVRESELNDQISRTTKSHGGLLGFNQQPGEMVQKTDLTDIGIHLSKVYHVSYNESGWFGLVKAKLNIIGDDEKGELVVMSIPISGNIDNSQQDIFEVFKTKDGQNLTQLQVGLEPHNQSDNDTQIQTLLMRIFEAIAKSQDGTGATVYLAPSEYIDTLNQQTTRNNLEHKLDVARREVPWVTVGHGNTTINLPTGTSGKLTSISCGTEAGSCLGILTISTLDLPTHVPGLPPYIKIFVPLDFLVATPNVIKQKPLIVPPTPTQLTTPSPTPTPIPTINPTDLFPSKEDELNHQMDPRVITH